MYYTAAAPSSAKSRLSYQAQQQPVSNGHPVNKQQPDTDPKGAAGNQFVIIISGIILRTCIRSPTAIIGVDNVGNTRG